MSCETNLELDNLSLDCYDIPVGGLKSIYIANACDVALGFVDKALKTDNSENPKYGQVTCLGFKGSVTPASGEVYKWEFNKRDGVTNLTDAKTVDQSGLTTVIPTLTLEFPKTDAMKLNLANKLSNTNVELLMFIETTAGTKHVLGAKFGMRVSEVTDQSGTGRTDKNIITITFVGEESELSYDVETLWDNIINKASTLDPAATNVDWEADIVTNESYVPRKRCIPKAS